MRNTSRCSSYSEEWKENEDKSSVGNDIDTAAVNQHFNARMQHNSHAHGVKI
jgi:hypothetical protein